MKIYFKKKYIIPKLKKNEDVNERKKYLQTLISFNDKDKKLTNKLIKRNFDKK
jgi:hypothetical protein